MKTLLTNAILSLFATIAVAQTKHPVQDRSIKVLPVVVHVLYESQFSDIPDSEIQQLIAQVNLDFRRQGADTINTPDAFKPVAADTEIEFALATTAPDGSQTSGVTHTQTNSLSVPNIFETNLMKFDSTGGKSAWDPYHYVNIWLLSGGFLGGGLSLFPSAHGSPLDGVAVPCFNDDINYTEVRLTHHLGHYLGLRHTFNGLNTCSTLPGGNDGLTDTPDQFQSSSFLVPFDSCLVFPTTDVCSPNFPGIMFMNYMDDSPPGCANLFTQQQAGVMNHTLDFIRYSLLEPSNTTQSFLPKNDGIKTYPIPAQDYINITWSYPLLGQRQYSLYDQFGRLVLTSVSEEEAVGNDRFYVSSLPTGIYLLCAKAGDKSFFSKIVKL